jgi:20S proteasome alpha/beta subunit
MAIASLPMAWGVAAAAVGGVFWQSSKIPPTDRYDAELPLSSFGSHGRLFAVDATLSAVGRHSAASVVSLCCRDGVVTVYTTTQSPYIHSNGLLAVESVGKEWLVSPSQPIAILDARPAADAPVVAAVAGTGVDQLLLRSFIQEMAERYLAERNSASAMARRLADALQLRTQQPSQGRVPVAACLLLDSQCIWKIDASGQLWKLHGGAIGRHAPKIEQYLLQTAQSADTSDTANPNERIANLSSNQAIALARDSILSVYERANATAATNEDNDHQQDLGSVRMQGFVLSRQGRRALDHDSLMTMSIDNNDDR